MGIQQVKDINIINSSINPNSYNNSSFGKKKCLIKNKEGLLINDIHDLDTHPVTPSFTFRNQPQSRPILDFRKRTKEKKISKTNGSSDDYEFRVFELQKENNTQLDDYALIDQCLLKHFFMKSLNKQSRKEIIKEMALVFIKGNTVIYSYGQSGSYFYIIKSGFVESIINNQRVKVYQQGDGFGEIALLHDTPRSETVITLSECYMWVVNRQSFKKIVDIITKINYKENMSFIESIYILAHLEHYQKTILASSLYKVSFKKGTTIVNKGNHAHCLYIIKEGEVECVQKNIVIRTLTKGDNFGERSILIDSQRTMDVIAKADVVCFSISITTLKSMLGFQYKTLLYLNFAKHIMHNSPLFKQFHFDLLEKVFYLFEVVNLSNENVAFPIGHVISSKLVIVIDGNLINARTGVVVANRAGLLFEEDVVNNSNEKTSFPIIPKPDCLFLEADTQKVLELLGGTFIDIFHKCDIVKALSEVIIFNNIPKPKLEKIAETIKMERFKKGERFDSQGDNKNYLFIIKSGAIDLYVEGVYLKSVNKRDYFGEENLLMKNLKSAHAIAAEDSEVFTLKKEDFFAILDPIMKDYLYNCLYLQDNCIELKDLVFIRKLGVGNYGVVSLVKSTKNNYQYAIKAISRRRIDHDRLHHNLELEKSILLQIHHPFIVKLVKCLKDDKYIYFLMEYVRGQEMFEVIRDIGLLDKEQTQFFSACLIKAIEYLHKHKFIYRDIKPENIMIKDNGYVKLIDFGTAKKITDSDYTSTILGTPHYMAPEIIIGKGYSFQVDYWSIAICMYEFICGNVPFGEVDDDPMVVYLSIVNHNLTFSSFVQDREFKNLMSHMLAKNPSLRMTRAKSIQNHLWYNGFSWDNLMSLSIIPPYLPKMKRKTKELNIPFIHYMSTYIDDWSPSRTVAISPKQRAEYDKWYSNY